MARRRARNALELWKQIEDIPQLPMMGVEFARQFVVAFVVGGLFLAYFAFVRFNDRPSETRSSAIG
jgi:hypothetical protein